MESELPKQGVAEEPARSDEPIATLVKHFDQSDALPDWDSLDGTAKETHLRQVLDDDVLTELIDSRDSLRQVYRSGELEPTTEQLLVGIFESVDHMIGDYIRQACADGR